MVDPCGLGFCRMLIQSATYETFRPELLRLLTGCSQVDQPARL